jgi:hypothetical protein
MVRLGADVVLVNTPIFAAYGGDMTRLKAAVRLVRQSRDSAALAMKDIVVDEYPAGFCKRKLVRMYLSHLDKSDQHWNRFGLGYFDWIRDRRVP